MQRTSRIFRSGDRRPSAVGVIDLAAVVLFVLIGRSAHGHGLSLDGVASTAWPFLSGLTAGWVLVVLTRWDGASLSGGVVVLISAVALGMILRVVSGQGTAPAFVGVALGFLGLVMLGWRALLGWLGGRAARLRSGP